MKTHTKLADLRLTCRTGPGIKVHTDSAICGYFEETALCRRSPGVTAIAPTGRPSPGARFAKGLFRPIARAVCDSVARGASPAPGRAARGRGGGRPDVPVPWRQELRAPPGPPVTFRRVRAVRLFGRPGPRLHALIPTSGDHPDPVQVFGLTYAYVRLSRQNIRRYEH
jgi:hypothetical protein